MTYLISYFRVKWFGVCFFALTVHQYTPVLLVCTSLHRATALGVKQNHVYTFFPNHFINSRTRAQSSNKKVNTTIAPVQLKRKEEWRNLRYVVHSFIWKTSGYWSNRLRRIKKSLKFYSTTILNFFYPLGSFEIVILRCGFNS